MGKVLGKFANGFVGAISRSIDNVVISMKNGAGAEIPFGAPVFHLSGENTCLKFDANTSASEKFLGFAVRDADKTPEEYGSNEGSFKVGDPVEVLVRGNIVLKFAYTVNPGSKVYIRKADGALVTDPGNEGTTLELPNVIVRTVSDGGKCAEVLVRNRNVF